MTTDYSQWSQDHDEYPSNWPFEPSSWPIESYLAPVLQDTRFLSHIIFPDIPGAPHIYHWQASSVLQPPYSSSPVTRHSRAQYSRTRGGSVRGSVGRKRTRTRKAYPESYGRGRYTTLSRNITILPPNPPYLYSDYDFSPAPSSVQLVRKPRTWRKGYKSPSKRGIGKYLGNFTNLILRNPPSFRLAGNLHPLLSYRSRQPTALVCDLRVRPGPESGMQIKALGRPANALDLYQLATSPPTYQPILIWHPKLPWKLRIEPTNAIGITIQDVLTGLYEQLRIAIAHDDYYTVGLVSEDRELISGVFHERCAGDSGEVLGGVRRVDFLGQEFCFVGLLRSRNGTWEMKTAFPERQRMMLD